MNLSTGSVLNMAPAGDHWHVAFNFGDGETAVCPVIGWATVVTAQLNNGTSCTELKPAFVWGDMVWTETDLHEHTPGLTGFTLRHANMPATTGPFADSA